MTASTPGALDILNALSAHVAVLDPQGTVVAVNDAWLRFARENGAPLPGLVSVGVNYLEICRRASGHACREAQPALAGLEGVLNGTSVRFELEYPCPAARQVRWFLMTASALSGQRGAVVAHVEIPRASQAQEAMTELTQALEQRVTQLAADAEQHARQLQALTGELTHAEERERRELAVILHDDLSQWLALARMKAIALRRLPVGGEAAVAIDDMLSYLDSAIASARGVTRDLRPPLLEQEGLVPALELLAQRMQKELGLTVDLIAAPQVAPGEEDRLFLFRAVRELLINVIKHASTNRASVEIRQEPGRTILTVADQGAGFDTGALTWRPDERGGFGLCSVRERAALLGGRLEIDSAPGRGTRVSLILPSPHTPGPGSSQGAGAGI